MPDFDSGTPKVIDGLGKGVSRDEQSGIAFASFKAHKFSYLNITSLNTDYVLNVRECGLACVNIPSCFSFNLAALYDVTEKLLCELLPSDKYNNSDKFLPSKIFHHFSIRVSINSPNLTVIHRRLAKRTELVRTQLEHALTDKQRAIYKHCTIVSILNISEVYTIHIFLQRLHLVI